MGTEVPEQCFDETTQQKETDGAIDNGGNGGRKECLDQEGTEEYVAEFTSTWLGSSQGEKLIAHAHEQIMHLGAENTWQMYEMNGGLQS